MGYLYLLRASRGSSAMAELRVLYTDAVRPTGRVRPGRRLDGVDATPAADESRPLRAVLPAERGARRLGSHVQAGSLQRSADHVRRHPHRAPPTGTPKTITLHYPHYSSNGSDSRRRSRCINRSIHPSYAPWWSNCAPRFNTWLLGPHQFTSKENLGRFIRFVTTNGYYQSE